jgi:hypothetical protein
MSSKTQPDSRGLDPAIHAPQAQAVLVPVDTRPKAGHDD